MPFNTQFVPARRFLCHRGVSVYHTYRNDDIEQGEYTYWFVLREDALLDEAFDVRELRVPSAHLLRPNDGGLEHIPTIIQEAIEAGLLDGLSDSE